MSVGSAQFELFTDDPRIERKGGIIAEFRQFYRASQEMRGLLTTGQASKVLGVNSGMVSQWVAKGRLSSVVIADVKMVSAAEVLALYRERAEEGCYVGGRGHKAPSLRDMAESAYRDCFEGE